MSNERNESPRVTAARERLSAVKTKADAARAALDAERTSEEAELARLDLEAQRLERERVRLERERLAEPLYRDACRKYGEHRTAIIRTLEGPLVFRPMTAIESDDLDLRQEGLSTGVEKSRAAIEAAVETCLYPAEDEFRRLLAEYPALAIDIFTARNAVQRGVREEARGKG